MISIRGAVIGGTTLCWLAVIYRYARVTNEMERQLDWGTTGKGTVERALQDVVLELKQRNPESDLLKKRQVYIWLSILGIALLVIEACFLH